MDDLTIGDYCELIVAITDGYTQYGSYNVIFPPPMIVLIVDEKPGWFRYGVKVIRENDLPLQYRNKNFRTKLSNYTSKGNVEFIGNIPTFFLGDECIEEKYFETVYWQPHIYLRHVKE